MPDIKVKDMNKEQLLELQIDMIESNLYGLLEDVKRMKVNFEKIKREHFPPIMVLKDGYIVNIGGEKQDYGNPCV